MQRLEVSRAVQRICMSLGAKGLKKPETEVPRFHIPLHGSVRLAFTYTDPYTIPSALLFLSLDQWLLMSAEGIFCPLLS